MNRRKFIKTVSQIMIAWGLSSKLAFASETNKILSGKFFIDGKEAELNFQDLNSSTIETKNEKSIIKVKDDFYLIRPETKLQFISKNLLKVVKGSVHAVFGKRQEELNVEIPYGTIGIRGTSIFIDIEPEENRSYFCNCYGETVLYDNDGKLIKTIVSDGHKSGAFTDDGKFRPYFHNYLFNKYAKNHPRIFDDEMEKAGCIVKDSHCTLKS